ncbi:MAG TPA: Rrf2 family transcriptional regulator [Firmicutes bacterium]|nr:Rrf2 family transcriptional regulator [Bacillota bacterium]
MRLSTRGRYGVRAMYDLALHYGEGPVPLKGIAERQMVSENYLEQLMASLRRAGLVISSRGAQGGYELARRPADITIGDIVRVLEGPIDPAECVGEGDPVEACERADECTMRLVWKKLKDCINRVLDSISLKDLCDETASLTSDSCGSCGAAAACARGARGPTEAVTAGAAGRRSRRSARGQARVTDVATL